MSNVPGKSNPLKVTYTHEEDLPPLAVASPMDEWKTWGLWAGLLALLVLVTHLPMLGGRLADIYQDDVNFVQNPFLMSGRGWIAIWRFPHSQFAQFSPLGYSLLWLQMQVIPVLQELVNPNFGYYLGGPLRVAHFMNVLLHLGNVLLLWTLLRKLEIRGSWLAAAIFAVHPLQVQGVQWISAQPFLLGTLLGLSSLIVYLRFCGVNPMPFEDMALFKLPRRKSLLYIFSFVLFVLAILAKPWLAILPLAVLLLIWWERGSVRGMDVKTISPFLVISMITVGAAIFFISRDPQEATNSPDLTLLQHLTAAGRAVWAYLLAMVFPYPLAFSYPRWHLPAWQLIFIPMIFAAMAGLWALRKRYGRALPVSGAMYLLAILPAILYFNEANLRGAYIADFCAYLAVAVVSAGACSFLAWKFSAAEVKPHHASPWVACGIILAAMVYSIVLSIDYRKPEDLLETAAKHYPRAHFARVALAEMKLARRDEDAAVNEFREVLQADPTNRAALMGMGSILYSRKQYENAMGLYLQVLNRHPGDAAAMLQISQCHLAMGDSNRAMLEAQSVLDRDPNNVDAYNNLALIAVARGEYDRALALYAKAIDIAPTLPNARINRANLFFSLGDPAAAEEDIMMVLKHNPGNFEAIFNAASMVAFLAGTAPNEMQRDMLYDRAEHAFRIAVEIRPDAAIAHHNLGKLLFVRGKYEEAIFFFRQACQIEPGNVAYQEFHERAKAAGK